MRLAGHPFFYLTLFVPHAASTPERPHPLVSGFLAAADALSAAADPEQIGQLRLVLRLMESRAANLALTGKAARFRDLSPVARERYLLGWGASSLALKRSAFTAYRTLLTFLAYADPGTSGAGNPLLAAIDYRPDDPPVTSQLTASARRISRRRPARRRCLEADVVVVGSGAGRRGRRRGPGGGRPVRRRARGGPARSTRRGCRATSSPHSTTCTSTTGCSTTWDGSVTILAGGAVGGGTTVNWMTSIDAPADVRAEWAREHGIDGVDGAEWDEDRAAIESELGVAPAVVVPPKDEAILRGAADSAGRRRRPGATPPTAATAGAARSAARGGRSSRGIRAHLATAVAAGARLVRRRPR